MPLPMMNLAAPPPGTRGTPTNSGNLRVPGFTPSGRGFDPSQYGKPGPVPGEGLNPIVKPGVLGFGGGGTMNPWDNPFLTVAMQRNPGLESTLINRYGMPSADSRVQFPTQYAFLGNQPNAALQSWNPKTGMAAVATPNNPMRMGSSGYAGLYTPWGGYP